MKIPLRFITSGILIIILLICAQPALAHPLGNFTINHYTGLLVSREEVKIDYILDLAEIPAFQEIDRLDDNRNGQPDPEEISAYPETRCNALRQMLALAINGEVTPLTLTATTLEFPPGAGGLLTLRLNCVFLAKLPYTGLSSRITFDDRNDAERLGWREIVVNGEGVSLQGDFATTSLSHRLTAYPQDLLQNPLDQRQVSFMAGFTGKDTDQACEGTRDDQPAAKEAAPPATVSREDAFTRLIHLPEFSFPALLVSLIVACAWGGLHALTPGHGKTIVAAYLVGSRGTPQHALYLGLTTTITHTAGVLALGLITLFASRTIFPERIFPWLSFLSGLLVAGIGLNLFITRIKKARMAGKSPAAHSHPSGGQGHSHSPLRRDHEHPGWDEHTHSHAHPHEEMPADDHGHDHPHNHSAGHSHLPPGADGNPVTWRSLLALGISGGLLPCPSALVVMLGAIALGRTGLGLLLVVAFSLGLAGMLTITGLTLVYAGRLFERLPVHGSIQGKRILSLLPAVSALFIALVGLGITARALIEIGVIRL